MRCHLLAFVRPGIVCLACCLAVSRPVSLVSHVIHKGIPMQDYFIEGIDQSNKRL
ncbi:hypothetical protein D3C87_1083040 [compost metagenome]